VRRTMSDGDEAERRHRQVSRSADQAQFIGKVYVVLYNKRILSVSLVLLLTAGLVLMHALSFLILSYLDCRPIVIIRHVLIHHKMIILYHTVLSFYDE